MGVKIGLSSCGNIEVFENGVLRRISSSKNGEVTGRLGNNRNIRPLQSVIILCVIKIRSGWKGHMTRVGDEQCMVHSLIAIPPGDKCT
jgi:hypothetical protein